MTSARDITERDGQGGDPESLLDRLVEESLTDAGREAAPPAPLSAAELAEQFLENAAAFLRRRQDRDALLARLTELSQPPAAPPAATEAPAATPSAAAAEPKA
jgi:hypothetical protein